MSRLSGKTAVITGGATGIGLAAAKRFIKEGAFAFIFSRRQESLDAALADLGPNGRANPRYFANSGTGNQLRLGEITVEHCDEILNTNVKGTVLTVQKALPLIGKGGSITLTGSSAGTMGAPAFSLYSASKAAEALGEEGMKVFAKLNPLQRMADPAEIGAVAAFLASQDSSFMTASEVAVDGGLAQI
ncbi:hypothetical protein BKA61DRAFT_633979 [Leptodontidium sp. MPI-SDFR-AT-0119]|nr:hypothetical protein BKA61DRAFT_633979 [Leptodontidium sp. MPI-SDFR-AT-0119]